MKMKVNSLIDSFLCLVAKVGTFVLRVVPLGFSVFFARLIGLIFYYLNAKKRSTVYKNIKTAFPEYPIKKIKHIAKYTFMNSSQHFIEIFYLPWMDSKYLENRLEVEGLEVIAQRLKNNKGTIFLGTHEGSWEIAHIAMGQILKEHKFTILARTQPSLPKLSNLLNSYRKRSCCNVIEFQENKRTIVQHLKKGYALGMALDHGAHEGILIDFFGKPALIATGAVKLALKLKTNFIVGFIKRVGLTRHKLSLVLYEMINTGNVEQDIRSNLEKINKIYENFLREAPQEYLWFFKRWKYSPERRVLILDDGKTGHFKQSIAVLELIKKLPFQTKANIVELKLTNKIQRVLIDVCGFFSSRKCQGCLGCVKKMIDKDVMRKLSTGSYDAVISTGASLAMINRFIAYENRAKSIVIMKPGGFSLKRFDLAIVPEHDNPPDFANVVKTKGSLCVSDDVKKSELINKTTKDLRLDNPALDSPVIGLLLGGDNKDLVMDLDTASKIIYAIKQFQKEFKGTLLVSTSRRTPNKIIKYLKENLSTDSNCRLLIIANENNPPGAIDAILHLSDLLVVSGDSISMVTEAVNSEKYATVFKLRRKGLRKKLKHDRFISNLSQEGYIYDIDSGNLLSILTHLWRDKPIKKKFDDEQLVLERLKQIL